jgi:hypothetical protein
MSATALPITLTRFSSALADLPIDAIYAKHTELRNNIAHMQASNTQLEEYARENDDRECYEALLENRVTIKRFEERIGALKAEVVGRGLAWRPVEEEGEEKEKVNGEEVQRVTNGVAGGEQRNTTNGTGGEQEDGVFL